MSSTIVAMKYKLVGGYVTSSDGDHHYISAEKLRELYNLRPDECLLIDEYTPEHKLRGYTQEFLDSLITLGPRPNGNYVAQQ